MHRFSELITWATDATINRLGEVQARIIEALQTSGATVHVKGLQMLQLQRVITAVGMFSIFEAELQDAIGGRHAFAQAQALLDSQGKVELKRQFALLRAAINVLKHGRGSSYDELLREEGDLPFRLKQPDEAFFCEGDVSEVSGLIEVDDQFLRTCCEIIVQVSDVVSQTHPLAGL